MELSERNPGNEMLKERKRKIISKYVRFNGILSKICGRSTERGLQVLIVEIRLMATGVRGFG
jgi:hypothetical protein